MSTLLLRLAGPLQAWGDDSRFARRATRNAPSKSGVLGMIAAAQGRRRADEIEDLLALRFGVRIDQPGVMLRDFQTAIRWSTGDAMPLSTRYYLSDAVFVAGLEADRSLLEAIDDALARPRFPLYLGRRSCPVTGRLRLGIVDDDLDRAIATTAWQASDWVRQRGPIPRLEVYVDAGPTAPTSGMVDVETRRDVPLSFNPTRREYGWRNVRHYWVDQADGSSDVPDFFGTVKGS